MWNRDGDAKGPNFTSTYRGVNVRLAYCLNSVLNVKALVGAFNQKKALVGAFSVIVKTDRGTDGSFYRTSAEARSRHIVVQIL